jgi:hypothetical protein
MSRNKPIALMFTDKDGIYTRYCKDKKLAVKLMQEELDDWKTWDCYKEKLGKVVIKEEDVKETVYRHHMKCGIDTIGDDVECFECGEPCGTNGRSCFAIWF